MARKIVIRLKHDNCMVSDLYEEEVPEGWDHMSIIGQMEYLKDREQGTILAHVEATAWLEDDGDV